MEKVEKVGQRWNRYQRLHHERLYQEKRLHHQAKVQVNEKDIQLNPALTEPPPTEFRL